MCCCWYWDVEQWEGLLWSVLEQLKLEDCILRDLLRVACTYLAHPAEPIVFDCISSVARVSSFDENNQEVHSLRCFDFALGTSMLSRSALSFSVCMDKCDSLLFIGFARQTMVGGHRQRFTLYYDGNLGVVPIDSCAHGERVACLENEHWTPPHVWPSNEWPSKLLTVTADPKRRSISFEIGTHNLGELFTHIPDYIMQDLTPFISFRFPNRTVTFRPFKNKIVSR
jgi:hypothetical protein